MNPFSIQRILVPTDLSHTSLNALSTAVALARKHFASLYLLNISEPDFTSPEGDADAGIEALTNASDVLAALAGTIQYGNGMRPQLLRMKGNVTETIVKSSLEHHIDLIVMGTHGASGYRDGFIGSNTYEVIKYSSCPVLSVPATGKFDSFQKVLYPIRPVQGALMRYEIASHFLSRESSLHVLGLSYGGNVKRAAVLNAIIEEVSGQLALDNVDAKPVWGAGISIADDVLKYAQQTSPDLLIITSLLDVISKPGFVGPHTQKIINRARIPVLNIKKIGIPAFS